LQEKIRSEKESEEQQAMLLEMKKQLRKRSKAAEKVPGAEVDPPKTKKQSFPIDTQRAIKPTEDQFNDPEMNEIKIVAERLAVLD
jgi:hypothetical protein